MSNNSRSLDPRRPRLGEYVRTDSKYLRPREVDFLVADPAKARRILSWEPKIGFKELVRIMVDADMEAIGLQPIGEGMKILQARFSGWHQWGTSVSGVLQPRKAHVLAR